MTGRLAALFTLLAALAGCAQAARETPPASAWGDVLTVGEGEQAAAPALWADAEQVALAWIGADETGLHHDAVTIQVGKRSARVVLPLPPARPYAQSLLPAQNGELHLLWLDANADGETRLYGALLSPALAVLRGPTLITDERTLRYAAVPSGDGSVWVVSSGGPVSEPGLYARWIDPNGRPRQENLYQVAADADWPSLTLDSGGALRLFWRQHSDGQVFAARLDSRLGLPDAAQPVIPLPLETGDRLESLAAAQGSSHTYLFWNVTRADSTAETWWASAETDTTGEWPPAARLGLLPKDAPFQTGFNTGAAQAAAAGEQWASWAAPLPGERPVLPVAARVENTLAILYFQGGQIVGYQAVVPDARLIGPPALRADRDQFLYLAWSHPLPTGKAALRLASLKPLLAP